MPKENEKKFMMDSDNDMIIDTDTGMPVQDKEIIMQSMKILLEKGPSAIQIPEDIEESLKELGHTRNTIFVDMFVKNLCTYFGICFDREQEIVKNGSNSVNL